MEKKQIFQVKKFVAEVRGLCQLKSNQISSHTVYGMSPKVILRRLTPKAIEQHTRQQRERLRRQSLSEGEESTTSSCTTSEDEGEENPLPHVQNDLRMPKIINSESVDISSEIRVAPTSVAQHITGSDVDENVEDVLDSDWSDELPNLNDPSWVSPSKEGNNMKSPKKRQWKKKKMRDENIKKKGVGKLMMHARKAFEHQQKMFISSNIEKKKPKIVQASSISSRDITMSPESVQQDQQLKSPTPPEPNSLSSFSSTFSSFAPDNINHGFLSKLRANMCQSIPKDSMNDLTQTVCTDSLPQLISSPQHMAQEGVVSTQDSPPAFGMTISNIHTVAALSPTASENEGDMNTDDINVQEDRNSSYDSDQTVAFEASPPLCSNIEKNNLDTVKEGTWGRNTDDGSGPKKRKRIRLESQDNEIVENNKKIKPNAEVARFLSYDTTDGHAGISSKTSDTVPHEIETATTSKKTKPGELVYESSSLVLAPKISKMLPAVDKENQFCTLPSEAEPNNKGSLEKQMEFFKEISKEMLELTGKKTKCEEKIKLIKEECDKKITLLESEKKQYESEIEELTIKVHKWNDSAAENETSHTAEQETDPLEIEQPTFVMVNSLARLPQDVSSYKLSREIAVFKSATRDNITEGPKNHRDQLKNRIINIIPAANISHFGSATQSPNKKQTAKKSMAKPKAAAAAAAAAVAASAAVAAAAASPSISAPPVIKNKASSSMILQPVSSNLPSQHKVLDQTNRDSAHVTIAVVSNSLMLQPQNPPPTQVQSSTTALWPTGMITAQPVVSSTAPMCYNVTNVLPPQLLGVHSIQPAKQPPTYAEHHQLKKKQSVQPQQLITADVQHKNRIAFIQQANGCGLGTVPSGTPAQLGQIVSTHSNQPQVSVSMHQQQPNTTLVQMSTHTSNPLLNKLIHHQPQQNLQHLLLHRHQSKSLQQHHSSDRQGTVVTGSSVIPATLRSSLEGSAGQCIKLGAAGSKPTQGQQRDGQTLVSTPVSKPGHQSHLLVSAIPAHTSGAAMARFGNNAQSSPSVVHTPKPDHQPPGRIPYIPTSSVMGVARSHQQAQQATTHQNASMKIASEATVTPRSCFLCGVTGEFTCCNSIVYCSQTCQVCTLLSSLPYLISMPGLKLLNHILSGI
ncbi:uncharacterized protein [Procambarus clarkii]|uniref:uncharacterized protein isoform X2 n=1 Tax=Procambarus clarkii TaxID=6728 RepID=UPI0037430411